MAARDHRNPHAAAYPTSTLVSAPSPASGDDRYRITDLTSFLAEPANFFAFTYRDTLKAMITAVVETESPMRTDILCQRVARAHGWLRTGAKIRERIDMHLRDFARTHESSGEFIWKQGAVAEIRAFRPPANEEGPVLHSALGNKGSRSTTRRYWWISRIRAVKASASDRVFPRLTQPRRLRLALH